MKGNRHSKRLKTATKEGHLTKTFPRGKRKKKK